MCLALPDAGNDKPLTRWQRLLQAVGFAGLLLHMLAAGLLGKLRGP
jgi:hypothetical protein